MRKATPSDTDQSITRKIDNTSNDVQAQEDNKPTFDLKIILLLTSVFLCVFLVGLDRTIVSTGLMSAIMGVATVTGPLIVYYLPLWFQSVKHVSAVSSGIRLLPLMLSTIVGAISGGIINQKIGYYTPLAIMGACLMSIGAGLLTTLQVDTGASKWIGYQVLYGLGVGYCFQSPMLAAQTVLPKQEVPMGLALILFGQLLGASIFVSVGENVLSNQLLQRLSWIPGFDRAVITSGGATTFLDALPAEYHETALVRYNESLRKVFQIGLIIACLAVLGVASLEWKSVKKPQEGASKEQDRKEGDEAEKTSA
ncbi:uncharacterized protein N0V89_006210 [Didymosphaeria variabile]|uniref:MFS general substrate transporter n=1 Tax=Didymosphaeria variabile TaxID=1932322 RepID=A0A9W9CCG3_9PLEO|nr:uncharacterized protein N0V89_006210 [Didymosphaeria variabile]KAJ4354473.1 hypothetical protein N0V89_006210 [Didymosphaeria variabile]